MNATARAHQGEPADNAEPLDGVPQESATEYATRGARRDARPHLRMVSPLRPERASRGLFLLIVAGTLVVGMIAMLVINTSLAQGAFTVSELEAKQAALTQQEQALSQLVAAAAAPDLLEERARALGMVPSQTPVFLRVPSGKVVGKPKAAPGGTGLTPKLLTPADATATEAVDNAGADFPAPLGADYDPAAADAAAAQGGVDAKAMDKAAGVITRMAEVTVPKVTGVPAVPSESSLWGDTTVIDVTGNVSSSDAGLVARPVR